MEQRPSSKTPKQHLQVQHKIQTNLSAWKKGVSIDPEKSVQSHQSPSNQKNDSKLNSLEESLSYFEKVEARIALKKNSVLQKHLSAVETIALQRGLPPEAFEVLLNVALSGKLADTVNSRLLKSLIPASIIPENCVVSSVSWLCVSKCSSNIQVLFLRWLITMFDFIDHKEQIHALYGFFFSFLQDEKMCPYVCNVLYLLTRKESVKPFRIRRLLDLQAKMGMQSYLQALLSLYKFFCPELVTITLPGKTKVYFKNPDGPWKAAINTVRQRNQENASVPHPLILSTAQKQSRKRKWNSQLIIPASSANKTILEEDRGRDRVALLGMSESFPVEQLQTFSQLLQNIHRLEFPSRMGSVLTNPLLLHYMNCIKDESVHMRLYYWMGQTLQEECTWCVVDNSQYEEEFKDFLETVYKAECFLQEGFLSCEEFLYKSLPLWDGSCCRSQVLRLVSWISLSSFSEMKSRLCDPLTQLFLTSSVYFKCSVLECLKELLQNWLNFHVIHVDSESDSQDNSLNTTLSGQVNVVAELIHFVGRVSTVALRLENNSTLLLYFILDFYETASGSANTHVKTYGIPEWLKRRRNYKLMDMSFTGKATNEIAFPSYVKLMELAGIQCCALLLFDALGFVNGDNILPGFASLLQVCDIYLRYDLPLLIMPPAGIFYPALLSMDPVNLNRLCYIMYRYRTNLVAAKKNELSKKKILQFKFSSKTYQEYNQYLSAMVGCLWTSNAFQKDVHPQGLRMDDELLKKTGVKEFKTSLNIVHHPAMMGYAVHFLQQAQPDDTAFNFSLIKGKKWDWYLEYLYAQGLSGLKLFVESSINRVSQASHSKAGNVQERPKGSLEPFYHTEQESQM